MKPSPADEDVSEIDRFEDLPKNAQQYVLQLEKWLNVPISMISLGPARHQTIIRDKIF